MITVRGKIENGKVLALEPVDDAFEGKEVNITLADRATDEEIEAGWASLMESIRENQFESGIPDLAHQHDHYLYGPPKRED